MMLMMKACCCYVLSSPVAMGRWSGEEKVPGADGRRGGPGAGPTTWRFRGHRPRPPSLAFPAGGAEVRSTLPCVELLRVVAVCVKREFSLVQSGPGFGALWDLGTKSQRATQRSDSAPE